MDNQEQRRSPPKLPPKSRFNDQESTAVLRLLVKQEKLLKNKDENPALRLTPEKSVRHLPPVMPDLNSLGEEAKQKENMGTPEEFSYYSHLPACISGETPASAGGIYQSPKLARAKERPKVSYGRRQQQQQQQQQHHLQHQQQGKEQRHKQSQQEGQKQQQQGQKQQQQQPEQQQQQQQQQQEQTEAIARHQSRRLHERERTYSYEETISNVKEQTLKLGIQTPVSRTRSCPVNYDTHIPPISQNKHSMNWINSSSSLTNSLSKMNLKSGES